MSGKIKVAVTYRVLQHWRAPVFARLNALSDLDVTVLHGQDVPNTKLVNAKHVEGFNAIEHFTLKRSGSPWVFQPFLWWSLLKLRPDVILAEGASNLLNNMLILVYARLFRVPVIWWTLGELRGKKRVGLVQRCYRMLVVMQERSCRAYLGYSSVALSYFRAMGYPPQDCFRAVNCVDTDVIMASQTPPERIDQLVRKLELGAGIRLLFVGALTASKKIERLLRAFQRVVAKYPDTELIIVGDGTHFATLRRLAEELSITDNTRFVGKVIEGVGDYFEISDIFVLPGLGGLAVSEALAHGLPVICGQGDGCEVDLVINGKTGYRCDADDDDQMIEFIVQSVEALCKSRECLEQFQVNSEKLIREKHNIQTYLANVADAIRYAHSGRRVSEPPKIAEDESSSLVLSANGGLAN